jgi:hypothetical protein
VRVTHPADARQERRGIARYWCEKAGIAYLGRADTGHDVENKVVPFGAMKKYAHVILLRLQFQRRLMPTQFRSEIMSASLHALSLDQFLIEVGEQPRYV